MKTKIILASLIILVLLSSSNVEAKGSASDQPTVNIVFAGQSNMTMLSAIQFEVIAEMYDPSVRINRVFCAVGGTSVAEWQRGEAVYNQCIEKILAKSLIGNIDGIVFIQGEKDAKEKEDAELWAKRFRRFAYTFRADTGSAGIPIVYVQLSNLYPEAYPYWGIVRNQQVLAENTRNSIMVRTDDIDPAQPFHYSIKGRLILGARLAHAWINIK